MAPPAPRLIIHLLRATRHPVFLIGSCVAAVAYAVYFPIMNTDIWWHLAAGRWMVQEGVVPRADPFSVVGAISGRAAPWVDVHWFFQLLSYAVFKLGGLQGLVLIKALLCAVSAGVLVLAARGVHHSLEARGAALASLTVAVTFFMARHLVLARPIIITLLCLSLTLLVLERYCRGRRARVLWWLMPIQLLWANCQGLFLLGPGLVGIYFTGEWLTRRIRRQPGERRARKERRVKREAGQGDEGVKIRWLGAAALGLVACSAVTPFGLEGLLLPFKLLSRIEPGAGELFRFNVTENVPPWILARDGRSVAPLMWVALVTCASFLCSGRRLRISHLLATAIFLALALIANRNVLLFFWLAGFVLAVNLGHLSPLLRLLHQRLFRAPEEGRPEPFAPLWLGAASLSVLALLGALRYGEARAEPPVNQLAPFRVPVEAAKHLAAHCPLPPRTAVFNSVRYGGYLIWELFPRVHASIDGRLVIRSASRFAQHLALADGIRDFGAFAAEHQIKVALLPTATPDRYLPLVRSLYLDARWTLVFTDGTQTLFLAADQVTAECRAVDLSAGASVRAIAAAQRRRWAAQPVIQRRALLHLARLLAELGELGHARELLKGQANLEARSLLARVLYLDGDRDHAAEMARRQLARHPEEVDSLALLALIAADRGEAQHALDLLQRVLEQDPYHRQAQQLLARIKRE